MPKITVSVDVSDLMFVSLQRQATAAQTTVDALATAAVAELATRAAIEFQQQLRQNFDDILSKATDEEKLAMLAIVEPIRDRDR